MSKKVFTVASNCIVQTSYIQPAVTQFMPKLLDNAILPAREVSDSDFSKINRRMFQGDAAMRVVERLLEYPKEMCIPVQCYNCGGTGHMKFECPNEARSSRGGRGGRGGGRGG